MKRSLQNINLLRFVYFFLLITCHTLITQPTWAGNTNTKWSHISNKGKGISSSSTHIGTPINYLTPFSKRIVCDIDCNIHCINKVC